MSWKPITDEERKEIEDVYRTAKMGRDNLYQLVKAKYPKIQVSQRSLLNEFLKYQPEYQTHRRPNQKASSIAPLQILKPGYGQCDLVSMRSYPDGGYTAFFHVIDGFTKKGYARALRTESEQEVTAAAQSCIEQAKKEGKTWTVWQFDNGSHFQSIFTGMLDREGIKHFYSRVARPQSNSFAEVRGGYYKHQLFSMMEAAGDKRWVKNLPIVVGNANVVKNFTTHQSPDAMEANLGDVQSVGREKISQSLSNRYKMRAIGTPLFIGQTVRMLRVRPGGLRKPGLLGYWNKPVYKVVQRIASNNPAFLPTYKVQDESGRILPGRYEKSGLLLVPPVLEQDEDASGKAPTLDAAGEPEPEQTPLLDNHVIAAATRRSLRLDPSREGEYEVAHIIDKRRRGKRTEYLVRWVGYGPEDDTWQSVADLSNAKDAIKEYEDLHGKGSQQRGA